MKVIDSRMEGDHFCNGASISDVRSGGRGWGTQNMTWEEGKDLRIIKIFHGRNMNGRPQIAPLTFTIGCCWGNIEHDTMLLALDKVVENILSPYRLERRQSRH